ncbi:MAG TPA: hypothetical protein VJV05_07705 [Pyrinomonadaceae bacterium]|nr:hypothetical protein [Pyrinomonadaceae bacterium]
MIAGAVGIVYYFYHGVQVSMQELEQQDQQRQAAQSKARPNNFSRSQAEKQRAGSYASAVSNSQSIKDHQKHIDETEKAMNQVSNSK